MDEYFVELRVYKTVQGKTPFIKWFVSLRDGFGKSVIISKLDRLSFGIWSDAKMLGSGLHELRLHFGPGYRVYYGKDGDRVVLLLCGGSKSTQRQDINRARSYWADYLIHRNYEKY